MNTHAGGNTAKEAVRVVTQRLVAKGVRQISAPDLRLACGITAPELGRAARALHLPRKPGHHPVTYDLEDLALVERKPSRGPYSTPPLPPAAAGRTSTSTIDSSQRELCAYAHRDAHTRTPLSSSSFHEKEKKRGEEAARERGARERRWSA